jgi:hypothetical protein
MSTFRLSRHSRTLYLDPMGKGQSRGEPSKITNQLIGFAAAALILLLLAAAVSRLVMLWCPRTGNCRETAQFLFWSGLLVSSVIAGSVGLAVRDLMDRRTMKRSS